MCERPPAGRFAPRLSPFVRGTLNPAILVGAFLNVCSVPLTKGDSRERSDRQGVAHKPGLISFLSHNLVVYGFDKHVGRPGTGRRAPARIVIERRLCGFNLGERQALLHSPARAWTQYPSERCLKVAKLRQLK